eukprot:363994-Chlamydomonas_euryale.AAC.6
MQTHEWSMILVREKTTPPRTRVMHVRWKGPRRGKHRTKSISQVCHVERDLCDWVGALHVLVHDHKSVTLGVLDSQALAIGGGRATALRRRQATQAMPTH